MASTELNVVVSLVDQISGKLKSVQNNLDGFTATAKKVGTTFTAIGVAGTAFLGIGLNVAKNFEKQMSSIKALTGATDEQMKATHDLALQLGSETAFTALEAAQGIEELLKAGVSMSDIMGGAAKGALDLAAAGGISVAEAATVASTALNAFSKDGITVARAADILAGAANASAADISDLQLGLSQASAVASGVGLTFEDTSATLAAFANNGLRGSDAGTSLKTMLMNLQPITDRQVKLFKELGIVTKDGSNKFYDAAGKIRSMSDIAGTLHTAMAGLTDQQRIMALEIMFGSDAIRAGNVLFKEGADGINNMKTELNKFTAADVAAERMNNLWGAIDRFKAAVETGMVKAFEKYLPIITKIVDAVTQFITKHTDMIPVLVVGVAVVTALSLAAGALLLAFAALPSILGGVAIATDAVSLSMVWAAITFEGMALPITIAIAALVALVAAGVLVYQHWDTVKAKAIEVWDGVRAKFEEVKTSLGQFVDDSKQKFEGFKNKVAEVIDGIKQKFVEFAQAIQDFWTKWGDWIEVAAAMVTGFFLPKIIQMTVTTVIELGKQAIAWAVNTAKMVAQIAIMVVTEIPKLIAKYVMMTAEAIANLAKMAVAWVVNTVKMVAQVAIQIGQYILLSAQAWLTALKVVAGWVLMAGQSLIQAAIMASAWLIAMGPIPIILALVAGMVVLIIQHWEQIKNFTIQLWSDIVTSVKNFAGDVATAVTDVVNNVTGIFQGLVDGALDWGGHMINNFVDGIKAGVDNIGNTLGNVADTIKHAIGFSRNKNIPTELWGMHMMQNFAEGIDNGNKNVEQSIADTIAATRKNMGKLNGALTVGDLGIAGGDQNINVGRTTIGKQAVEAVALPSISSLRTAEGQNTTTTSNKETVINIYEAQKQSDWLAQLGVTLRTV